MQKVEVDLEEQRSSGRGGGVDVEPSGQLEARPADRSPRDSLATLAPMTKSLMKLPSERKPRDTTRGARRS